LGLELLGPNSQNNLSRVRRNRKNLCRYRRARKYLPSDPRNLGYRRLIPIRSLIRRRLLATRDGLFSRPRRYLANVIGSGMRKAATALKCERRVARMPPR
jgi:hypothetical protein